MTEIKYLVIAGEIISKSDGQRHYIHCDQLIKLYGVHRDECVFVHGPNDWRGLGKKWLNLLRLTPRHDGNYTIDAAKATEVMQELGGDRCAYCGELSQGNHAIHRDGMGIGPEVPLCDGCGTGKYPTCDQIWERISHL